MKKPTQKRLADERKTVIFKVLFAAVFMAYGAASANADCTDADFAIYKRYDSYLESHPNISTSQARANVAKEFQIPPGKLKNLYFECIPLSVSNAKAAQASKAEDHKTVGVDCRTLGYRYGKTSSRSANGLPTNPDWDFVKPSRCNNSNEFDVGISQGLTLK